MICTAAAAMVEVPDWGNEIPHAGVQDGCL